MSILFIMSIDNIYQGTAITIIMKELSKSAFSNKGFVLTQTNIKGILVLSCEHTGGGW